MDDVLGFDGRYNRAKMWIFVVALTGWFATIAMIAFVGFDWKTSLAVFHAQAHPGAVVDWGAVLQPLWQSPLGTATLAIILLMVFIGQWVNLAVMTKRLHDRGKSIWWLVLYWLVPLVWAWLPRFLGAAVIRSPGLLPAIMLFTVAIGILNLWVFVELFCLRGTHGANPYGPDPLSSLRTYIDA